MKDAGLREEIPEDRKGKRILIAESKNKEVLKN